MVKYEAGGKKEEKLTKLFSSYVKKEDMKTISVSRRII